MKESDTNNLKPIFKLNEVQENINKAIADMTYFISVNSHDIIECDTNKEYYTSYACDIYDYDDIKARLDDLRQLNGLKLFVKNIYKELEQALNIVCQVVKCRFLGNLLSLSYEMLFCSAFNNKENWNRNRFDNYDFTFLNEKYDSKVVKLIQKRIPYDFVKLIFRDKEETERVVKKLLEKDLNKDYESGELVNRCIHLFISGSDNEKSIVQAQADLMESYNRLKDIAKGNRLNDYTIELKVKDKTIKALVFVYVCD
ncbi:MAG: hypothetical protein NC483_07810 [Ruminococcus sp.]|nr:hypothetical protein [Ruminococcus sp.]